MASKSLTQTSCLGLLKAIDDLGKLNGGGIVPVLSVGYIFIFPYFGA